jgi:hypothetical protein
MDRLLSKITPRSFTLEEKGSTESERANEDEEETRPRLCTVATGKISVLSLFIFSLFVFIHLFTDSMQFCVVVTTSGK